jgi:hypothetical protein
MFAIPRRMRVPIALIAAISLAAAALPTGAQGTGLDALTGKVP